MSNEAIVTDKAPAALGTYSAAVKYGNVIHVSGQLPVDPATGEFAGEDIASQTRQSLTNIQNILAAAGATMANVAECTVLLDDINDFAGMNEVYGEFFSEPFPARAAFEVAALPKAAKVEIKAVCGGNVGEVSGLVIPGTEIDFGAFISAVINFLIVAAIVFAMVKALNKAQDLGNKLAHKQPEEEPAPAPVCPFCLEEVNPGATKCCHCGSELPKSE